MSFQYNSLVLQPTAVSSSVFCKLLPKVSDQCGEGFLIVSKTTRLEAFVRIGDAACEGEASSSSSLSSHERGNFESLEVRGLTDTIFGRIRMLVSFTIPSYTYDHLLILTETHFFILHVSGLSEENAHHHHHGLRGHHHRHDYGSLVVVKKGSVYEDFQCPVDPEPLVAWDPRTLTCVIHNSTCTYRIIQYIDGAFTDIASMRATDVSILSLCFMAHSPSMLTTPYSCLCILIEKEEINYVKAIALEGPDKIVPAVPWASGVEARGFYSVHFFPGVENSNDYGNGGIILLGQGRRLGILAEAGLNIVNVNTTDIGDMVALAQIPHSSRRQFLIGDDEGNFLLFCLDPVGVLMKFGSKPLSSPSCLSMVYFDQEKDCGEVFIGSKSGNSLLVEFNVKRGSHSTYLDAEVTQTLHNLGPVMDFCIVKEDIEAPLGSPRRFFTCSGSGNSGSLRRAEIGIGVDTYAETPTDARRVFSIHKNGKTYILLCHAIRTEVLVLNEAMIEAVTDSGFITDEETLWCASINKDEWVQVTYQHLNIAYHKKESRLKTQAPIVAAHSFRDQVLIGFDGKSISYLCVGFEKECINKVSGEISAVSVDEDLAAIGMYDCTVQLFSLPLPTDGNFTLCHVMTIHPTTSQLHSNILGPSSVPHSLLLHSFSDKESGKNFKYLFMGFARGTLLIYGIDGKTRTRNSTHSEVPDYDVDMEDHTDVTEAEHNGRKKHKENSKRRGNNAGKNRFNANQASNGAQNVPQGVLKNGLAACRNMKNNERYVEYYGRRKLEVWMESRDNLGVRRPVIAQRVGSNKHIFICAQQPCIIQTFDGTQLTYSQLNLTDCTYVASVHVCGERDDSTFVFMCDNKRIVIGSIPRYTPSLYVNEMLVGNSPSHIAFHTNSYSLIVSVQPNLKESMNSLAGRPMDEGSENDGNKRKNMATLLQICPDKLELQATFNFDPNEQICSLMTCNFGTRIEYVIAGTIYLCNGHTEPKKGRIILLTVNDEVREELYPEPGHPSSRFRVNYIEPTKGAVFTLKPIHHNKLVATVNHIVIVYRFDDTCQRVLTRLAVHDSNVMALHLDVMDDLILVGDMMRSACLLKLKQKPQLEGATHKFYELEELGRDWNCMWSTAVGIQNRNTYLVADDYRNLCTFRFDENASPVQNELEVVGKFNIGQFINRMHRHNNVLYWMSMDGAIGEIRHLEEEDFQKLLELQNEVGEFMAKGDDPILKIPHSQLRKYEKQYQREDHFGHIDGMLLKQFVKDGDYGDTGTNLMRRIVAADARILLG